MTVRVTGRIGVRENFSWDVKTTKSKQNSKNIYREKRTKNIVVQLTEDNFINKFTCKLSMLS